MSLAGPFFTNATKMSKETNVERAKLAEQAERYDDMAQVSVPWPRGNNIA